MELPAGAAYVGMFNTIDPTGAAVNADSTPTATAYRNGAADAGFVLTVANVATGVYKVTGTVPAYTDLDMVTIEASATVGGVAVVAKVDAFIVRPDPREVAATLRFVSEDGVKRV